MIRGLRLWVLNVMMVCGTGVMVMAQTVEEAFEACFEFTLDQDTDWFDARWSDVGRGVQGDERISRFVELEGPIKIIEAHYLWLDQGNIVTVGSDCGVFVDITSDAVRPAFNQLQQIVVQRLGALLPVSEPHENAIVDVYVCHAGRDYRLGLSEVRSDDAGHAYWMWARYLPDSGRGCELS